MQSTEEAADAAYDCVLKEAERYMNESYEAITENVPMKCSTCRHFHPLKTPDDMWEIQDAVEPMENRCEIARQVAERMGVCDLRLDEPTGMLYAGDFAFCDEENGYEEVKDGVRDEG